MEKNTIIIIAIILVICLIPASIMVYSIFFTQGCTGETIEMEQYYVNEWGIFKQEYNSKNVTYLIGPQPGIVPKPDVVEEVECKPVIYFHGNGKMELSAHIATSANDIRTIPDSKKINIPMDSNREMTSIIWDLEVAGDINDNSDEAKVISSSGEVYDYLFYEGKDVNYQNILASVIRFFNHFLGPNVLRVSLQNIGSYTMEDIVIICDMNRGEPKRMIHYPGLRPNEVMNQTKDWDKWSNVSDLRGLLKNKLISRDLTEDEGEDLLNYWIDGETDENGMRVDKTLLEPEGDPTVQILFFIPEEEYNYKLPMEFSKAPNSINRVGIGYVFNIPIIALR